MSTSTVSGAAVSWTAKWVRLALVAEALRRHGRGGARRLIQVKKQIHRYLAELLYAIGEQKATGWGEDLWQRLLKSDPLGWKDIYNDSVRHDRQRLDDDPVPKAVSIYVSDHDSEDSGGTETLANVQEATGGTKRDTRERLMRAFNTPFFPDILVCSEVMGEVVDLQRFCRHVIHHDLAWNHSVIEQRTGRIDRLGCKAEGQHPIDVYLPYLAGTADERQFRVMTDREKWFRVVMGQEAVAQLITPDNEDCVPLPEAIADELNFNLSLRTTGS